MQTLLVDHDDIDRKLFTDPVLGRKKEEERKVKMKRLKFLPCCRLRCENPVWSLLDQADLVIPSVFRVILLEGNCKFRAQVNTHLVRCGN